VRQLILPGVYPTARIIDLDGEIRHYLGRVLRLKPGATFPARDGQGGRYDCRLVSVKEKTLQLEVRPAEDSAGDRPTETAITLVMGIPKGKKMDLILRQAAEAGVRRVIPFLSENSVVRLDEQDGIRKQQRWQKICREALQQSGTAIPPEVTAPISCEELQQACTGCDRILFFHEKTLTSTSLHQLLASDNPEHSPRAVALLVGPEGGFSHQELDCFRRFRYDSVHLGASVLRAETAALYAVAAVQTILRESPTWQLRSPAHSV
jgi:16S rRNA (uracil1498-N3)-methyltransferase